MKKKIIAIFLVLLAVLCFTVACDKGQEGENTESEYGSPETEGGGETNEEAENKKLVAAAFQAIAVPLYSVKITSEKDGLLLSSYYNVSEKEDGSREIEYAYEEKSTFVIQDSQITVPPTFITMKKGKATFADDRMQTESGDPVPVELEEISAPSSVNTDFLTEITVEETVVLASVTDLAGFFGTAFIGTDGKISVERTGTTVSVLTLQYTLSSGAKITAEFRPNYTFPMQ